MRLPATTYLAASFLSAHCCSGLVAAPRRLGTCRRGRQPPQAASAWPASADIADGDDVRSRVVAVGDVHGDGRAFMTALRLGGLVERMDVGAPWAGGRTKLVLVGDLLDRGDDELLVLAIVARLRIEARAAGGAVVCVLGNHEVMNAMLDFRYTTRRGNAGFTQLEASILAERGAGGWGPFAVMPDAQYPGIRARAAAFAPGGLLARSALSRFPLAAKVDGCVACPHLSAGFDELLPASAWGGSGKREP